jgi:hypothetical protein
MSFAIPQILDVPGKNTLAYVAPLSVRVKKFYEIAHVKDI